MFIYPLHQFLAFLIIIVGVWLAVWVYLANRKSITNRIFSLFTISFLLWAPLPYFFNLDLFSSIALHLVKFGYGAVALFLVCFYFFVTYFPRVTKRYSFLEKIVFSLGIVFFFISIFSNIIVEDIKVTKWGINPIFGIGKIPYFGFVFFLSLIIVGLLFKKYSLLSKSEKLKIQYVLLGLLIFVIPNLIFNVIFPFLSRTAQVRYYPFGNYSAIFLLGFTAYAIVKRELFGIRVVLTTLLVSLIAILLALDALVFTPQTTLQILKGVILVIFLYFGYLLIKSVLEERKRREEVERLSKAKSEFISIASHQLRTPLTAIKGYISMILEGTYGKMTAKIRRPMENVYKSNERLIKLVNDLLSVSRIESGRIELELEKTSLEDLIFSVVQELKITAKKKGLRLKWQKPAEPLPETLIDKDQIRQVILNVIDNAIRYTHYGQIVVKLKRQKEFLLIEISDTGGGLSKEEISYLFESFSRGRVGARLWSDGMGLGLYVAKKFVEMHQGKIWTESPGKEKGSTFYIELPIK